MIQIRNIIKMIVYLKKILVIDEVNHPENSLAEVWKVSGLRAEPNIGNHLIGEIKAYQIRWISCLERMDGGLREKNA